MALILWKIASHRALQDKTYAFQPERFNFSPCLSWRLRSPPPSARGSAEPCYFLSKHGPPCQLHPGARVVKCGDSCCHHGGGKLEGKKKKEEEYKR
eukprot:14590088-Ditylum_brightwellii.AAC.1